MAAAAVAAVTALEQKLGREDEQPVLEIVVNSLLQFAVLPLRGAAVVIGGIGVRLFLHFCHA